MRCPNCQKSIPNQSLVCGYCGKAISKLQENETTNNEEKLATKQKIEEYTKKIKHKASDITQNLKNESGKTNAKTPNDDTQNRNHKKNNKYSKKQHQKKSNNQKPVENKSETLNSQNDNIKLTGPNTTLKETNEITLKAPTEDTCESKEKNITDDKSNFEIGQVSNQTYIESEDLKSEASVKEKSDKKVSLPLDKNIESNISKQQSTKIPKNQINSKTQKSLEKAILKNIDDEEIAQAAALAYAKSKKNVIPKLHRSYKPLNTVSFFFTELLLLIPIVNILLLFIWAFRARSNANRKAFARSILIWILIFILIIFSMLIAMIVLKLPIDLSYWFDQFKDYVNNLSI